MTDKEYAQFYNGKTLLDVSTNTKLDVIDVPEENHVTLLHNNGVQFICPIKYLLYKIGNGDWVEKKITPNKMPNMKTFDDLKNYIGETLIDRETNNIIYITSWSIIDNNLLLRINGSEVSSPTEYILARINLGLWEFANAPQKVLFTEESFIATCLGRKIVHRSGNKYKIKKKLYRNQITLTWDKGENTAYDSVSNAVKYLNDGTWELIEKK